MHELSLAHNLVETAVSAIRERNIPKVDVVHVQLGALSGVTKDALLLGYDIAVANTLLAGSELQIEELPVIVMCTHCQSARTLADPQMLCCPICKAPTTEIIQGKEIEIVSLTYDISA